MGAPAEQAANGTIIALERNARVAFDWTVCGTPGIVTLTLTPEQGEHGPATKVAVRHELEGPLDVPRPRELIDDWWRFVLGNLAAHATGRGEVLRPDFADPNPEIRLSMTVNASSAAVFRALTEPEALRAWMGARDPVIEPYVGGRFDLGWGERAEGEETGEPSMKILDIVPNQRLTISWPDWRGDSSVPTQSVTWHLAPDGTGTKVTLVHAGFIRTVDFSDYPFGWGHFMSEMAKVAVRYEA